MHTYNSICNIYTNMKSQRCEFRILDDEHMSNYQQTTTKLLLLSVKQLIWVQQQIEPPCWHCLFQLSNQPSPVSPGYSWPLLPTYLLLTYLYVIM